MHPTRLNIITVSLLTLCGKGIKQSQFPRETDDSESNFHLARINLAHTLGALTSHSQATVCLSFRFMDRATLPGYSEPDPLCSRGLLQHIIYNFLSLQESVVKSTCRADQLLGLPRTIFTACGKYFQTLNYRYHTLWPYPVHQHRRTSTNSFMILIVIARR